MLDDDRTDIYGIVEWLACLEKFLEKISFARVIGKPFFFASFLILI